MIKVVQCFVIQDNVDFIVVFYGIGLNIVVVFLFDCYKYLYFVVLVIMDQIEDLLVQFNGMFFLFGLIIVFVQLVVDVLFKMWDEGMFKGNCIVMVNVVDVFGIELVIVVCLIFDVVGFDIVYDIFYLLGMQDLLFVVKVVKVSNLNVFIVWLYLLDIFGLIE